LGHGGNTSTKFEIEVYMKFLNDFSLDKHARVVGNEYEDILEEGNRFSMEVFNFLTLLRCLFYLYVLEED
jgi:hypothetical protein